MTLEQLEHLRKTHLSILFNKKKNLIEIGWVCECGDKPCNAPHTMVAFYVCPKKPCPPGDF